jgi:hypothetical protein
LSGKRYAYTNAAHALKIGAWPSSGSATLLATGADQILRRSDSGGFVMYRAHPVANGLSDLSIVSTSTKTPAVSVTLEPNSTAAVSDNPFANGAKIALWLDAVTVEGSIGIGNAMAIPTSGSGSPATIASGAAFFGDYGSPVSFLITANTASRAGTAGGTDWVSDLIVGPVDGSKPLTRLAEGVAARGVRLRISTIVYGIPVGTDAGLWVMKLP